MTIVEKKPVPDAAREIILPDFGPAVKRQVNKLIERGFHKAVYPALTEEEAKRKYVDDFTLPDGFVQPEGYINSFPKLLVIDPRIDLEKQAALVDVDITCALPVNEDNVPDFPYAVWIHDATKLENKNDKIRDVIRLFEENETGGTNLEAIALWLQYPEYFSERSSVVAAGSHIGMDTVSILGLNDDDKLMFGPTSAHTTCEYLSILSHGKNVVILGNRKK